MSPDSHRGGEQRTLGSEVEQFASALHSTVRGVIGDNVEPFHARDVRRGSKARIAVNQQPAAGIELLDGAGSALFLLDINYQCTWDDEIRYLTVESSAIKVRLNGITEPLFRYEFERHPRSRIAGAHVQVHGHRDELLYAMVKSDRLHRAKVRGKTGLKIPRMSELHFPVGGTRMRPCLEDVLEFLIHEFGVTTPDNYMEVIQRGRLEWREKQLAALIRRNPEIAITKLRELGLKVEVPDGFQSLPDPHMK